MMRTKNVLTSIQRCQKVRGCWGDRNPNFFRPIVVPCKRRYPKVMIVTEQANTRGRGNSDPNWDPARRLLNHVRETGRGGIRGVAPKINKLFEDAFLHDFDEKSGSFNEFYWTHFIKCPGNFRKKKEFNVKALKANACADKWLLEEIQELKPKLIVTFGASASTWVLLKTGYKEKWTERIWDEFKWVLKGRNVPYVNIGSVKTKLIVALHPSGLNPLAITFNEKIGALVKTSFDKL